MANRIKLLPTNQTYYKIVIVGAGANGSHFIRGLCQDISTYINSNPYYNTNSRRLGFDITLCDGDKVEQKNLSNQLFTEEDINEYKVRSLADRYGEVYELKIKSYTEFVKDMETLQKLFPPTHVDVNTTIPILVGMVDNNRSRQLFHEFFHSDNVENLLYLDAGVEGVTITNKPRHQLTVEEEEEIRTSGFSGQVVCGLKWRGHVILDPVTEVFPNILDDANSSFPGESCGDLIVNNPQRCATNKFAAQIANNFMNVIFQQNSIYWHVANFNAMLSACRPTYISQRQVDTFNTVQNLGYSDN